MHTNALILEPTSETFSFFLPLICSHVSFLRLILMLIVITIHLIFLWLCTVLVSEVTHLIHYFPTFVCIWQTKTGASPDRTWFSYSSEHIWMSNRLFLLLIYSIWLVLRGISHMWLCEFWRLCICAFAVTHTHTRARPYVNILWIPLLCNDLLPVYPSFVFSPSDIGSDFNVSLNDDETLSRKDVSRCFSNRHGDIVVLRSQIWRILSPKHQVPLSPSSLFVHCSATHHLILWDLHLSRMCFATPLHDAIRFTLLCPYLCSNQDVIVYCSFLCSVHFIKPYFRPVKGTVVMCVSVCL